MPNYLHEFPDYDYKLPFLEGFEDCSWHNDACPSIYNGKDDEQALFIFCDYKNPKRRETQGLERFVVCRGYGGEYLFQSKTWRGVAQFLSTLEAKK